MEYLWEKAFSIISVTPNQRRIPVLVLMAILSVVMSSPNFADDLDELPDPTMPYDAVPVQKVGPAKLSSLKLQTIVVSSHNTYALINGERVSEGSYIEGVRVESIQSSGVVVVAEGKRQVLTLDGESFKKQR